MTPDHPEQASHLPQATGPAHRTEGLMDAIYRHQRHVYDLTRRYYLLGRDRMIHQLAVPPSGTVLEIGCGTARNLIATAKAYPDATCYGIDISGEMLKSANGNITRAGLGHRIFLARADAAEFDAAQLFGVSRFDRIFFSYSLSMIPPWQQALGRAVTHLAPHGEMHCVDFSAQRDLPNWFARLLRLWLAQFHVTPRLDLQRELAALAKPAEGTVSVEHVYRDYAVLARLKLP